MFRTKILLYCTTFHTSVLCIIWLVCLFSSNVDSRSVSRSDTSCRKLYSFRRCLKQINVCNNIWLIILNPIRTSTDHCESSELFGAAGMLANSHEYTDKYLRFYCYFLQTQLVASWFVTWRSLKHSGWFPARRTVHKPTHHWFKITLPNTDQAQDKHMRNTTNIFSQVQLYTPWWWITYDPKHVGVIFNFVSFKFFTTYVRHLESKERLRIQPAQLFHFSWWVMWCVQ